MGRMADDPTPDPALLVQPDALARSIGIETTLTDAQREVFTDAVLDAQADVQAYLGRSPLPMTRTERGRIAWATGWDLRNLGDDDLIDVVAAVPEPPTMETFTVTYRCGLDPVNDPALRPILRFVKAHATNSYPVTNLWKKITGAKGEIRSVSAEGQSVSWTPATLGGGGGKPGDGTPGSLPTIRSLDRWRVAGRRVHQGPTLSTDRPFMGR